MQYRAGTSGGWTDGNHTGTATTATLTGLEENTSYQVQVRATNLEGTGSWSDSGSNSTDANAAPAFSSSAAFDAAENQTAAGTVRATDSDADDSITGYAITGGADQAFFSIGATSGALTFDAAPNYEDAEDAGTGNTYVVEVTATSGTGAREKTATQTITVTVTDVAGEAPGKPAAPSVAAASVTSLTVSWSAPSNAGPAISDYDVRYRAGTSGGWTDGNHTGTATTATLTGLSENTSYQVQVSATNDEGTSNWSESGEGMTVTPLTVEMMSGTEPPVESAFAVRFSFSEPVRGFTRGDIATQQEPPCTDSANNPISCNPTIAAFETTDNRIFTTAVTPRTDQVAHNYTLTLTVPAGRVTSAAGNKPNEQARLEVRVAPPGVTVPISSINLTANSGNGQVTLRWSTPDTSGGSAIVRYEYRWAESGGEFGDWMRVDPSERSAAVPNLTNGREYVFEVRGVNALGYGDVETARATPAPSPPRPGPGPPGPGPVRQTVPDAPRNLLAEGGDGQVKLTWEAPENDGGSEITDYEYRIDRRNPWISTGSIQTTHTVTGLVNGTEYVFEVRAVNRIGKSFSSTRAEATPEAPEVFTLDFAHFANGTGITSEMLLVNVAPHPIRPAIYFYDRGGHLIDPASVVDVTGDLEVTEDGSLSVLTEMEPLGQLTISTHGQGDLVSGSVKVLSDGPIGAAVRYNLPDIGVAGVGANPPISDALFPARQQAGGIRTAAALHNLEEEAMTVSCRLMSGGAALEEVEIPLEANGQTSWFIDQAFLAADTSDFAGSVHCAAPGRRQFTGLAVEIDTVNRIFTTLPLFPVDRGGGGREAVLDFAHFANGDGTTSDLVFVNMKTEPSGPAPTPFHVAIPPIRPAIYFYDTEGNPIAAESVVDVTGDLEISEDGGLTVQTQMDPMGVLTISTHGRGALVSGSVKVVSEGPIGGMLRFDLPHIGEAVVGASPPVRDAIFPVRRLEGGITTGVALHNLELSPGLVRCDLMRGGVLRDSASIPLEANGQTSWLIDQAFPATDTSDFAGSVRCDAVGEDLFTAVALEMDPGTRTFITLPVFPVPRMPDRE